jgi:L-fuculose-phosphate aldolase
MMQSKASILQRIIEAGAHLHQRNLLAAADGNISYRFNDREIVITPTGLPKAHMQLEDLSTISIDNRVISGHPSSERRMHLEIYQRCSRARCVVHAHPPTAVAWSVAFPDATELPADCLPEVILATGGIPIVPYARPSTDAMGENLIPYLPKHQLMVLARHGAVAWGESLAEAVGGLERVEHVAQMLKISMELNTLNPLPAEELAELRQMRTRIGDRLK